MWCSPSYDERDYYDRGQRSLIFVVGPDGRCFEEEDERLHCSVAGSAWSKHYRDYTTIDGWARGYVCHDKEVIEFYPLQGMDIFPAYDDVPEEVNISKASDITPVSLEAIRSLIDKHAKHGYNVVIEFWNHEEEYTYEKEEV